MARDIKFIATDDLNNQNKDFYKSINEGSDLACVLISTSYLDQCLATLLGKHFIVSKTSQNILDPRRGSIGTFSSRNDLAYCLGLISKKIYQNIKTAGDIRNAFAHSHLSLGFGDVSKLVDTLTFPSVISANRVENGKSKKVSDPFSGFTEPRTRFSIIMAMTVSEVMLEAVSTEHRAKK